MSGTQSKRPEIFVGSSREGLPFVDEIALLLEQSGAKPLRWEAAFPLGTYTLRQVMALTQHVDGAMLVASPDDQAKVRGEDVWLPRANVMVEFGAFAAVLGEERAALVSVANSANRVVLPTDFDGLTYLSFDIDKPEENRKAVKRWLGPFFQSASSSVVGTGPAPIAVPASPVYSWADVERGVIQLEALLGAGAFEPDVVLGLGRSGAIVGGLLASRLGSIPVAGLDISYEDTARGRRVTFGDVPRFDKTVTKVLVVDGATTSGDTLQSANDLLLAKFPKRELKFAVLIQSATSKFRVDFAGFLENRAIQQLPWHGPKSRTFLRNGP